MNNWSWAPMQTSNSAYGNFPINRKASDLNVDSDTNSSNAMGQQNQNQQQQQLLQSQFMQFSQPQAQPQSNGTGGVGQQNNYSFSPQAPSTATIGPQHTHTFENMSGGIQNYPGHAHQSQPQNSNQNQNQSQSQNQNQSQSQGSPQEAQIEYLTGQEAMDVLKKIDPNYEYMYQFPPSATGTKKQQHQHHHQQQEQQQQQRGITTQNMMPMEIGSGESPHNYQQQQRTNTTVKASNNNAEAKNVAFSSDINNGSSTRSKKQLSKSKSQGGGVRNQPPAYLQSFYQDKYQVPPSVRPNANSPNVHPQHPQVTSSQMKRMVNKPSYKLCGKCPKCKTLQGPPTTNVVNFNMPPNSSSKKFREGLASAYSAGNLLHNRFMGGGLGRGHSSTLFPR